MAEVPGKPRPIGINHVALEVDDLSVAIDFYRSVFEFELRGESPGMAFLDMGDQFLALSEGRPQDADGDRHFGLAVDDMEATHAALERVGAEILPTRGLSFRDPSGNHVQVVAYAEIQFSKAPAVARGMGIEGIEKTPEAVAELAEKGLAE